jgi:hypothetical protein
MSLVLAEASTHHRRLRDAIIHRIWESIDTYLDIGETFQSDPKICIETLKSCDEDMKTCPDVLDLISRHMPNFDDHKEAFLRFLQTGRADYVRIYMHHFGAAVVEDRDFLTEAIKSDSRAILYPELPPALRMHVELLKIAVETIVDRQLEYFIRQVPSVALIENEFILFRALDRGCGHQLWSSDIPTSCWQNRELIINWTMRGRSVLIHLIPTTFRNDPEICLALYACQPEYEMYDILNWIPKPFLADKSFVLKCLRRHPEIFCSCGRKLQEDVEVILTAAFRASPLRTFLYGLRDSLVSHVSGIHARLVAHDEFMTLLACIWKSGKLSLLPVSTLDCDAETARGLNALIAGYLGFSYTCHGEHLKRVWKEVLNMALDLNCSISSKLMPLLPQQALAKAVLNAKTNGEHSISLQTYPDELWANRWFVNWASERGVFSNAISDEFSMDRNVCLAYYSYSLLVRETTLPWISKSLKSDRSFVLECLTFDPLILNFCQKDLLSDFDVLLKAARIAIRRKDIYGLAKIALEGGWDDALVTFAKLLHMKIDTHTPDKSVDEKGEDCYFAHTAPTVQPLNVALNATTRREMLLVWRNPFIFCLALGRNVKEVCKSYQDWPQEKKDGTHF